MAAPLMANARLLALDVEWKPFHGFSKAEGSPTSRAVDCPASVLQVTMAQGSVPWVLTARSPPSRWRSLCVQVSTESHVFVFDLLTLHSDPALDDCLSAAFHNKVGQFSLS